MIAEIIENRTSHPLLEWFEYEPNWGGEDGAGSPVYRLPSEVTTQQNHLLTFDQGVWTISPVDIQHGELTVLDALTYADELQRLIRAASHLNAQVVTA